MLDPAEAVKRGPGGVPAATAGMARLLYDPGRMFGAPDTLPGGEIAPPAAAAAPDHEPADLLFSPLPSRRWGELTLWLAMAVSILFHALIVLSLPKRPSAAEDGTPVAAVLAPDERIEPLYLFPYLQRDRTETPPRREVPYSDRDRRAHGGSGAPSTEPGSPDGTTRFPGPPSAPPQGGSEGGAAGGAVVPPAANAERGQSASPGEGRDTVERGKALVLQLPKPGDADASGQLKGLPRVGAGGPGGGAGLGRGGQVDLGPVSFDTRWYEWGPYAREMLRRVRYHWQIPEIAQLGVPGVVRIRFFIERDGRVTGLAIEQVSGHPSMDFAARDAILDGSPMPPLPSDLVGVDREGVTITFFYNTEPPDWAHTDD